MKTEREFLHLISTPISATVMQLEVILEQPTAEGALKGDLDLLLTGLQCLIGMVKERRAEVSETDGNETGK
jgi:hypothetical protein